MESLSEERFADLYAQTITYGLFAARMKAENTEEKDPVVKDRFEKDIAYQYIPENIPLLREIFYSLMGPNAPQTISWIIDDITLVLKKANMSSILQEFKSTRWDEDPVIHFYETFLATYNPEEREKLGVYYTPLPVVSYIVRSIHKLLKQTFSRVSQ